jgi:hypothetical protein
MRELNRLLGEIEGGGGGEPQVGKRRTSTKKVRPTVRKSKVESELQQSWREVIQDLSIDVHNLMRVTAHTVLFVERLPDLDGAARKETASALLVGIYESILGHLTHALVDQAIESQHSIMKGIMYNHLPDKLAVFEVLEKELVQIEPDVFEDPIIRRPEKRSKFKQFFS